MKYFSPSGDPALFACPCGECDIKPSSRLLLMADSGRSHSGVPWVVISGPRCPDYDATVGGSRHGEHPDGDGMDVLTPSARILFKIIEGALKAGFTRIGINNGSIHLGVSTRLDQDVAWTYYK